MSVCQFGIQAHTKIEAAIVSTVTEKYNWGGANAPQLYFSV